MRIPSGKVDQSIYFIAVDATDYVTRETGLSGFTVQRSRNGAAEVAYTTPTVTQIDATNMPGVYALLVDEDTTIASGSDSEEMCLHITCTGMAPVTRTIELYRRDTTSGQTITVANGAADADIERIQGTVVNTPTVAGVLEVDVTHFNGTAGTFSAGRPEVNTTHAAGTAWNSGAIGAATLATDTITNAKIAADAIGASEIADGAIDRLTFAVDTGLRSIRSGTAQAGAAGTITLDASAAATTDFYAGCIIYTTGGTGVGQHRICTAYNGSTKVATISPNWATTPDNTTTFAVMPFGASNLTVVGGAPLSTSTAQIGVNAVQAGGTAWGSGAITAGSIASNAITSAKIATDAIGAAQIAADAIGASELATDAVTEIQSGLSTLTAAGVRTAVGLASANLDTQLDALPTNAELATALGTADDAVLAAIAALTIPTANQNADALLDRASGVETSMTLRQALRIVLAATAGKASGLATTTAVYRDTTDSKDRITATVDADGNRSAVTLDVS